MYVQMILYHSISFALFNIDFLIKKVLENKLINYAIRYLNEYCKVLLVLFKII